MKLFKKKVSTILSSSINPQAVEVVNSDAINVVDSNAVKKPQENSLAVIPGSSVEKYSSQAVLAIQASLEKLKVESQANSELRKLYSERFAQLSEQIGELRNMIMQQEKSFRAIEIKAERSTGLVESVQPDKLMINIQKADFKVEALKAKVEAGELLNNKIRDDLRDMRNKFMIFRNAEAIKQMNDDSLKRLNELKKVEANIVKHSDMVDSIFSEVEKTFKETKELERTVSDIQNTLKKTITENEKMRSFLSGKVSKIEMEKLREETKNADKRIIDTVMGEMEEQKKKVLKDIEVDTKKKEFTVIHQMIKDDLSKFSVDAKNLGERLSRLEIDSENQSKRLDKMLDILKLVSVKTQK